MPKTLLTLIFLFTGLGAIATDLEEAGYYFPKDINVDSALEILNALPLAGPEGLWEFQPDEVSMLILRDKNIPGQYNIFVVDAVDCRLSPGMKIGHMESSSDPESFSISLMSRWKKNLLTVPVDGVAKYQPKREIMLIEGKSAKLSITPSIILPNLLGLLRFRVNLKYNDPSAKLPVGLRRVYPRHDNLPSSPIYL